MLTVILFIDLVIPYTEHQSKATEFITLNHFETRVYFIPHIKILKTLRS